VKSLAQQAGRPGRRTSPGLLGQALKGTWPIFHAAELSALMFAIARWWCCKRNSPSDSSDSVAQLIGLF
jgi:hypothetical protein